MKVKELIEQLKKFEDAEEYEVHGYFRQGDVSGSMTIEKIDCINGDVGIHLELEFPEQYSIKEINK